MEEKQILNDVADTLLDAPITFTVDLINRTWLDNLLIKWHLKKPKKEFKISGATLGTMIKISRELLLIDKQIFKEEKVFIEKKFELIKDHAKRMAKIIAYAVLNKKSDPSEKLIDFFLHNLNANELQTILMLIVKKMDCNSFLISIISTLHINVLEEKGKMNPTDKESTIAPYGEQSAA